MPQDYPPQRGIHNRATKENAKGEIKGDAAKSKGEIKVGYKSQRKIKRGCLEKSG
jgi:hypothetical protein